MYLVKKIIPSKCPSNARDIDECNLDLPMSMVSWKLAGFITGRHFLYGEGSFSDGRVAIFLLHSHSKNAVRMRLKLK